MAQIAELNASILDEEDSNYLYHKDEYSEESDPEAQAKKVEEKAEPKVTADGYELPDHLEGEEGDDIIEIK